LFILRIIPFFGRIFVRSIKNAVMKSFLHTILAILLMVGLFGNTSFAQNAGVRFLPQAGLNLTKLSNEPAEDADKFRTGIEAGFWVQTKSPVFFMPGVFYGQQGLRKIHIDNLQTSVNSASDTILSNIDYRLIKLPVMLGIQALGARIYTGPTFTYIVDMDEVEIMESEFHDLSMGLNVGAGLNIALFSVDVRYEYGVSHVFTNGGATANTLTISAGLKF
jgi:hypothetical protein